MAFENDLARGTAFANPLARGRGQAYTAYDPGGPENNPINEIGGGSPNLLNGGFFTGRIEIIGTPNLDAVRAVNAAWRAGNREDRQMCNAGGGLVGGGGAQCYFGAAAYNKATEIMSGNAPDAIKSKAQRWLDENPDVDENTATEETEEETEETEEDVDETVIDWEGILDTAVTIMNGVKGIIGPGGIFIPLPDIIDGVFGGGNSSSGSTTTGGGSTTTTNQPQAGTACRDANGERGVIDENGVCVVTTTGSTTSTGSTTTATEGSACTTEDGEGGTIQGGVCVATVVTGGNNNSSNTGGTGDEEDDDDDTTITTGPPDRSTMTPSFCETGWEYPDGTCVPWEDIPGSGNTTTPIEDGTVCTTINGEDGTFQGGRCVPNITVDTTPTGPQEGSACQNSAGEDGTIIGGVCVATNPDRTTQIPSFCPSGYSYPDGTCVPVGSVVSNVPQDGTACKTNSGEDGTISNGVCIPNVVTTGGDVDPVVEEGDACTTSDGADGTITGGVCVANVTNTGGNGGNGGDDVDPVNEGDACTTENGEDGTISGGVCMPNVSTGGGGDDDDDEQAGDPCINAAGQSGVIVMLPDGTTYCAVSVTTGAGGDGPDDTKCDCGGGVQGTVNAAGGCDCPSITTGGGGNDDDDEDDDPLDPLIGLGLFAGSSIAGSKNSSITKNGPLFRILKSRGYQPKNEMRRPIAGWLSDIAKEFRS